jgi:hypothetical protein
VPEDRKTTKTSRLKTKIRINLQVIDSGEIASKVNKKRVKISGINYRPGIL